MANEFRKVIDTNNLVHPVCDDNRVDWESNAKTGVHQLFEMDTYPLNSVQTDHGVTYTIGTDGSVTISDSPTERSSLVLTTLPNKKMRFKKGFYKLSGCPVGGGCPDKYSMYGTFYKGAAIGSAFEDYGNGAIIYCPEDDASVFLRIYVEAAYTPNGEVFKPMITYLEDTCPDFTKRAMTNMELTDKVFEKREITSSDDLDNITEVGLYSIKSSPVNIPYNESYVSLLVTPCATLGSGVVVQTIFAHGHSIYSRTKTGNPLAWEPWYKFTGTVVS